MNKIKYVTLSPEFVNVELVKDVGQIPFILGKEHKDIDTSIVTSSIDFNGANIKETEGLKIVQVPMILNNRSLTGIVYLLKHSKEIDWLSLHHAGRRSLYWSKLYKFLNPKGKVYIKLDMDFRPCDAFDSDEWERKLFIKNTEVADLITVESEAVKNRIQKYSKQDIKILSNGFCKIDFQLLANNEREDCFATVGRLGTKQKATEILLDGFAKSASNHNWKLKLIGPIEEPFFKKIEDFYKNYPELKERVIFLGEIKDRKTLYSEMSKSKTFVLPSRWESFGIVSGEALSCGCRLILSDSIPLANEFTKNRLFGEIIKTEDVAALSEALVKETKQIIEEDERKAIKEYADTNFSWNKICDQLYQYLIDVK